MAGGAEVPQGPDLRVVRSELPSNETPAREGARDMHGDGDAADGGTDMTLGAEWADGQDDEGCASTSMGAQAETPQEQNVVGGLQVPPGPDPRLVRFKQPADETPAGEGAGGTRGDGDAGHGGAAASTTCRPVEHGRSSLAQMKANGALECLAAQRLPVPDGVPARPCVKGDWG